MESLLLFLVKKKDITILAWTFLIPQIFSNQVLVTYVKLKSSQQYQLARSAISHSNTVANYMIPVPLNQYQDSIQMGYCPGVLWKWTRITKSNQIDGLFVKTKETEFTFGK